VTADLGPEMDVSPFQHMCKYKMAKKTTKCISIDKIS